MRLWAMRGTIHLVPARTRRGSSTCSRPLDLTRHAPAPRAARRARADRPRALALIRVRPGRARPAHARRADGARSPAPASTTEGQAAAHLPRLAALDGHVVLRPAARAASRRIALRDDWLGTRSAAAPARSRRRGAGAPLRARVRAGRARGLRRVVGAAAARRPRGVAVRVARRARAIAEPRPAGRAAPPRLRHLPARLPHARVLRARRSTRARCGPAAASCGRPSSRTAARSAPGAQRHARRDRAVRRRRRSMPPTRSADVQRFLGRTSGARAIIARVKFHELPRSAAPVFAARAGGLALIAVPVLTARARGSRNGVSSDRMAVRRSRGRHEQEQPSRERRWRRGIALAPGQGHLPSRCSRR